MIPAIEFIYNYAYAKRLHQGSGSFDDAWLRVINIGGAFENIFEEYGDQILERIEQYTGYPWEEQAGGYIPVYVMAAKPSFASPMSLAVDDDTATLLWDCVYQLAHRNMAVGVKTEELRHQVLEAVTGHVLRSLGMEQESKPGIDLTHQSAKKYLSKQ